jgi:hypothetical protein
MHAWLLETGASLRFMVATGHAPTDDFEVVFGVNASFNPDTL